MPAARLGSIPTPSTPPLGKAILAGSMAIFGDNPYGWRIPAVVFGTAAIALTAAIVLAAGGSAAVAFTAAFLVAFDNLAFVHSRLGTLDVFLLGFSLLAVLCYLRRWPVAAGAALGLAGLVKINGLWLGLAFVAFEAYLVIREHELAAKAFKRVASVALAALVTFGAGLYALDRLFTTYATPMQHLQRIFGYGLGLKAGPQSGAASAPWQWLLNQTPMPYYHLDRVLQVNGDVVSRTSEIGFTGALNPFLIFLAPLALLAVRNRLGVLALAWFAAVYLPFFALEALGRVSYIFYFLPAVPAVAIALALLLERLPAIPRWGYLGVYLLGFASLFPFRIIP